MGGRTVAEASRYYPARREFLELSREANIVPVYREMLADLETPVSIYAKAFPGNYSCLLESVEGGAKLARYSFIAAEPFLTFSALGDRLEVDGEGLKVHKKGNPISALRELLAKYRAVMIPGLPRFFGGAVGYIGYDTIRFFERLPGGPRDDLGIPDVFLIFPKSVIAFDHYTSRIKVIVNAHTEGDPEASYEEAVAKIEEVAKRVRDSGQERLPRGTGSPGSRGSLGFRSNMTRKDFLDKVRTIKEYICAGDIFQAVLSQRFEAEMDVHPFDVYRALRSLNPSPYMYYLDFGEVRLAGASPELLVRLEDGVVETRPIAGTRPRGKTTELDKALEKGLLCDEKERAEHVMLVDLGRNDLGKVSQYGSVEVPTFMACERYSHVMHLVSEVRGRIREDKDALDAFVACFPAGTVSGAPKVRAMEIIDELEPTKRGPYAGAVGYFSFSGNMDTCITIRTLIFVNGKAYAQAGAGIVADSEPHLEYEETVSKARALFEALRIAREGLA